MKFTLHQTTWPTKGKAKKAIQAILQSAELGKMLDKKQTLTVYALLTRHPYYDRCDAYKRATNIKVDNNPAYGKLNRCFYVISPDEEPLAFSYVRCFQPPTKKMQFVRSCRCICLPQVALVKRNATDENGMIKCAVSGELVSASEIDVDHDYDQPETMFAALVKSFVTKLKIDIDATPIVKIPRTNIIRFKDEALNTAWFAYQADNANLRCVKRSLNQKTPTSVPV